MKNRNLTAVFGGMLCMGMIMTGCAGTEQTPQAEVMEMSMEDTRQPEQIADEEEGTEGQGQDTEYLSGKVQSPQEDGMTLAQTTITDEEGMVTLLEVKDARKIPVKFTADTRVEHWIIQGGGADIDMKEAAFSDLEEGQGVEVEGYFEGEDFVAVKVIIEEYV